MAVPNRMNFRKNSKWPLDPPPCFRKKLKFFAPLQLHLTKKSSGSGVDPCSRHDPQHSRQLQRSSQPITPPLFRFKKLSNHNVSLLQSHSFIFLYNGRSISLVKCISPTMLSFGFLAVQDSSITDIVGPLVPWSVPWSQLTIRA